MPRPAAEPPEAAVCERVVDLVEAAAAFVAAGRVIEAQRRWLPRQEAGGLSDQRMLGMVADSVLLASDLMLTQPSSSGATAFDRLAKAQAGMADAGALDSLRRARFRLLHLDEGAPGPDGPGWRTLRARDELSGEAVRVLDPGWPWLPAGTALFARAAPVGDGLLCLPAAITPLDAAALAFARGHMAAGRAGAGQRWAEAVYGHVVRRGTLEVPGLNRPRDGFDEEDPGLDEHAAELFSLGFAWAALEDAAPSEDLLDATRRAADLTTMLDALAASLLVREDGLEPMAAGFERLLLAQMDCVQRRERAGSGLLTLDVVARALDDRIAAGRLPDRARTLFASLRHRVAQGGGLARDASLERLLQRIQALRAKTVAQGCTEQEALAAAEKAAELVDRHGLSLTELELRALPCEGAAVETTPRRFGQADSCVPAVAAFFDCRTWSEQAKGAPVRHVFFGLPGDVAAARYLFELVEQAFDTETSAFQAGDLYAAMAGERRGATTSFQVGLAQGIIDKLGAMRAARDAARAGASGRDLVPAKAAMVAEELDQLGLALRRRAASRSRTVLTNAFDAGEDAGRRFEPVAGITRAA